MTLCFTIRTKMGITAQIVATFKQHRSQEGDELTSLDGKDVKDLKEPEILEALQSQRPLKFLGGNESGISDPVFFGIQRYF